MVQAVTYSKKQSNWAGKATTAEYRRNRPIVNKRDKGCCVRCLILFGQVINATNCDHYIPSSRGGSDDISNLWMLCSDCHDEKTQRESNKKAGFKTVIGLDGDCITEPDWLEIIAKANNDMLLNISSL